MPASSLCEHCHRQPWGPDALENLGLGRPLPLNLLSAYQVTKSQLSSSVRAECRWCEVVQDIVLELESRTGMAESDTLLISLCFRTPERVGTQQVTSLSVSCSSLTASFPVFTKSDLLSEFFILEKDGNHSQATPSMALPWLSECQKSHPSCVRLPSQLPSRILAISRHGEGHAVRLQCNTNEDHAPYAFLSYRWGGPQHRTLTNEVLDAYQSGICSADLPPTIQDAITVAQDLNFQYIWIDALCIVQDSPQDVAVEISKMHQYLRTATLVIFASGAQSVQDRFLDRSSLQTQPQSFVVKNLGLTRARYLELELRGPDDHPVSLVLDVSQKDFYNPSREPLNTRGWVFQERLLCPRLLIFPSTGGLIWQCDSTEVFAGRVHYDDPESISCRDRLTTKPKKYNSRTIRTIAASHPHENNSWLMLVDDYSRRNLSYPGDKLIAIAAIVEYYSDTYREQLGQYCAGIWRHHIQRSLHWEVNPNNLKRVPVPPRAPSWSWAAVDSASYQRGPSAENVFMCEYLTEALQCDIDLESPFLPFGTVTAGKVTLRGHLYEVWLSPSAENPKAMAALFRTEDLSSGLGHCLVDCIEYMPTEMSKLFLLPLWSAVSYGPHYEDPDRRSIMMGLMLKRHESSADTYVRVGSFNGFRHRFFETRGPSILSII